MTNADRLFDHVLGSGDPTGLLLESGQLPQDWIEEYLRLLQAASNEWRDKPMWPRQLVSAVHFASWYLPLRYDSWKQRTGQFDKSTEASFAAMRSPSEIFLMQGSRLSK